MKTKVETDKKYKLDINLKSLACRCTDEGPCNICDQKWTFQYQWDALQDEYECDLESLELRKALDEREILLSFLGGLNNG